MKVLVIDDNHDVARMIEEFLSRRGVIVDFINNGVRGLEYLKRENYDALIVDYRMPQIDGLEIAKYAKYERKVKKIIIITSDAEFKSEEYVILYKPFSMEILCEVLFSDKESCEVLS